MKTQEILAKLANGEITAEKAAVQINAIMDSVASNRSASYKVTADELTQKNQKLQDEYNKIQEKLALEQKTKTEIEAEKAKALADFEAVNAKLIPFVQKQAQDKRAELFQPLVRTDMVEDAYTLAKVKGYITDDMDDTKMVEAMTKFVKEKPVFQPVNKKPTPQIEEQEHKPSPEIVHRFTSR